LGRMIAAALLVPSAAAYADVDPIVVTATSVSDSADFKGVSIQCPALAKVLGGADPSWAATVWSSSTTSRQSMPGGPVRGWL
jgi:hypothetical protein